MFVVKRRYVYEDVDRHGNVRVYFRRGNKGAKFRCREKLGTEAFDLTYHAWLKRREAGDLRPAPARAPAPSTFRWLGLQYSNSVPFKQLDPGTQHVTRLILEKMFLEPIYPGAEELFADCPLSHFTTKAVRTLRDRVADRPEAANGRVRRLRSLFKWAINNGIGDIASNPAREVTLLSAKRAGGFPAWTGDDVKRFEDRHAIGTKARLAFAILKHTGVRRSDLVTLGRQHVRDGWLRFRPFKGRNRSPLIRELKVLPELQQSLMRARPATSPSW